MHFPCELYCISSSHTDIVNAKRLFVGLKIDNVTVMLLISSAHTDIINAKRLFVGLKITMFPFATFSTLLEYYIFFFREFSCFCCFKVSAAFVRVTVGRLKLSS